MLADFDDRKKKIRILRLVAFQARVINKPGYHGGREFEVSVLLIQIVFVQDYLTARMLLAAIRVHVFRSIYILLTECEGRTGRISARGLGSTDRAASARSVQERPRADNLPVRPEQTRSIRDLLHDF